MRRTSTTTFRKQIEKMEIGKSIYINALSLSINQVDYLRMAIYNGILTPDIDELRKMIKPEYIGEYLDGSRICPQMTYRKDDDNYWYEK